MRTIEPLEIEDLETVSALRPETWGDLLPIHEFYLGSTLCFPHKAVVDGRIVGIGTAIAFKASGWLAHIIVAPDCRGHGHGGALVSFLMDFLAERCGVAAVSLIATDMGYPVYLKHGFTVQAEYATYTAEKDFAGDGTDSRIEPITTPRYRAVLDLDRYVSGEDRTGILSSHLEDGYMYVSEGAAVGFFLPTLGEGLLVAKEKNAATALLRKKLSAGCKAVTLPVQNLDGASFLAENGFIETKRLRRMSHGAALLWHPEYLYGRIGGYLG
jgi:GNAT superfamily N-acetyltransferase